MRCEPFKPAACRQWLPALRQRYPERIWSRRRTQPLRISWSRLVPRLLLLGLLLAGGRLGQSASIQWINREGGRWSAATNWNPAQVPGPADTAEITASGTYTVTLDTNATIAGLTIGGASGTQTFDMPWSPYIELMLNGDCVVQPNGRLALGSRLAGTNTLVGTVEWTGYIGGVTRIPSGRLLRITGEGTPSLEGRLVNEGRVVWSNRGVLHFWPWSSGVTAVTNEAGAEFELQDDVSFRRVSDCPWSCFHNAGRLVKSAGNGGSVFEVTLNNSGSVEVRSGWLSFDQCGGAIPGGFVTAPGTMLEFRFGTFAGGEGTTFSGPGLVRIAGGNVSAASRNLHISTLDLTGGSASFNAPTSIGQLSLSGGSLGGNSVVVVTNATWTGGTMSGGGNGVTRIPSDGILTIAGDGLKVLDGRALVNAGRVVWSGHGEVLCVPWSGGVNVVTNEAGAEFEMQSDAPFGMASPAWFYNAGRLLKTSGSGTKLIDRVTIDNSGLLDVQSGTLSLVNGSDLHSSGTLSFGLRATTNFGRITLPGSIAFTGRLCATLLDGFTPPTHDVFEVMTFGSCTGDFTDTSCLDLGNGIRFQHQLTPTALRLVVSDRSPCPAGAFYCEDFEGSVGGEWSSQTTRVTPVGARRFLGEFGNDSVDLRLTGLPPHVGATLTFDLFILRSWDGNDTNWGPDIWDLRVAGGPTLAHTTFSLLDVGTNHFPQAYPDDHPLGNHPPRTGSAETNTLGYTFDFSDAGNRPADSVYRLSYSFAHSSENLMLTFSASNLQVLTDESWGLDNVVLNLGAPPCLAPPSGLLAWLPGDTNANDLAGSHHGQLRYGASAGSPGFVGGAFHFDGVDDFVDLGTNLVLGSRFTESAWIYSELTTNANRAVMGYDPTGDGLQFAPGLGLSQGRILAAFGDGQRINLITSPEVLLSNAWNHVAVTFDGTNYSAYANGLLVFSTNEFAGRVPYPTPVRYLGRVNTYFAGGLDEVMVFNRVLSPSEVRALYLASSSGMCKDQQAPECLTSPSGLVGWWPGDENGTDLVGGRTATFRGGASKGAGLVGEAFVLNGTNAFIEVPDAPALNFGTNDFTAALWVNFDSTAGEQVLIEKLVETMNLDATGWGFSKLADHSLIFGTHGLQLVHSAPLVISTQTWMHLAARRGSGLGAIFVDGVLADTGPFPYAVNSASSLKFGHRGNPADTPGSLDTRGFFLNGRMDEVTLFGRALSDGEIAAIHAAGSAGLCGAGWRFTSVTVIDQVFAAELAGWPRQATLDLEWSTNLIHWQWIETRAATNGQLRFVDPSSVNWPGRFYRAIVR